MKLLRLPLAFLLVNFAPRTTAPPTPESGQPAIQGAGIMLSQAFAQGRGGPAKSAPDLDMSKAQRDAIIKDDHRKNLDDAVALLKLAEELKADLEKETTLVVSVKTIKQTEDIERLAKSIHGRLKRD